MRSYRERHRNSSSESEVELMVLRSNLVPGGIAASILQAAKDLKLLKRSVL